MSDNQFTPPWWIYWKLAQLTTRSLSSTWGTHALDELPSDPFPLGHGVRHLVGKSPYLGSEFGLAIANQDLADSPPCTPDGLMCLDEFPLARLDLYPAMRKVSGHRFGPLAHVRRFTP